MRVGVSCDCALCNIESQLLRDLSRFGIRGIWASLFLPSEPLREIVSSSSLLL